MKLVAPQTHTAARRLFIHRYSGIALLFTIDQLLKHALQDIEFPSPLIGMTMIIAALVTLDNINKEQAEGVVAFFEPSLEWVAHKWLPCFYSPALVTLPLALKPLEPSTLGKAMIVVLFGIVLTAGFTGHVALLIRKYSGLEADNAPYHEKPITFTRGNYILWGGLAALSAAVLVAAPSVELKTYASYPLLLASNILGYMAGVHLPPRAKQVIHPVVFSALAPNVMAAAVGYITGQGYWAVLKGYVTKGKDGVYGPGDILFSFLGVIILSFGIKVFMQWKVLVRHRAEVLFSTIASAAFSMLSTALMARAMHLPQDVARGMVPRGATLALALPMADLLHAPQQITAASVALTGIIGANFLIPLLNAFQLKDPISRGLSAAGTAHGMSAAVLAAREPDALPYCALSYALCGVFASFFIAVPPFRELILYITG